MEFVGNVNEDYDYFLQLQLFLKKHTIKKPQLFIRKESKGQSLRLMTYDKEFIDKINGVSYAEIAAKGGGILNSANKLNRAKLNKA